MYVHRPDVALLIALAAAVIAPPALGQTVPAAGPDSGASQSAAFPTNLTGFWGHPSLPGFEPPASAPGPIRNRSRLPNGVSNFNQLVGDYASRVEDWRAGLGRSLYSPFLALSFASVTLSRPCHVSSPRHVERSVRISRTALSCLLHLRVYGPIVPGRLSALASEPCSRCTAAEFRIAIAYSTASSRSPSDSGRAPCGA